MEDDIRKVWFRKGKAWHCVLCRPPYREEDATGDGLPVDEWLATPVFYTEDYAKEFNVPPSEVLSARED